MRLSNVLKRSLLSPQGCYLLSHSSCTALSMYCHICYPFKSFATLSPKEPFGPTGSFFSAPDCKFQVLQIAPFYAPLNLKTKTGKPAIDEHKSQYYQGNRMTRFKSYCVIFTLEIAIITKIQFDSTVLNF